MLFETASIFESSDTADGFGQAPVIVSDTHIAENLIFDPRLRSRSSATINTRHTLEFTVVPNAAAARNVVLEPPEIRTDHTNMERRKSKGAEVFEERHEC